MRKSLLLFSSLMLMFTLGNAQVCASGTLADDDSTGVCFGFDITMMTNGDEIIPPTGNYGWNFTPGPGAGGATAPGGFSITGAGPSFTFDAGINGILAANSLDDMTGTWIVSGFAYSSTANPSGTSCGLTPTSRSLTFLPDGFPGCDPPEPCSPGTLALTDSVGACPDELVTVETIGDEVVPAAGGYAFDFEPGPDGTGALPGGFFITTESSSYTFDAGLNGVLAANSLDDLRGTWYVRGFTFADSNDVATSFCDITADKRTITFLEGTDPACTVTAVCDPPTGFSAQNETATSIDLSWTAGGAEDYFEIEIVNLTLGGVQTNFPTHNADQSPTTVGGLTPSTDYAAYLRSDCEGAALIVTGVMDGPLGGGTPKVVEFYVLNDIEDLSIYGMGSANNGGGSDGQEFTFPAGPASAGEFLYLATEEPNFTAFFGFAPEFVNGAASINGDDAIEVFKNGVVIDIFGDINVDGTGTAWEYLDGWAYRVDDTGPDLNTFQLANWTFSGPNALDGETSNATAATPFPIGSYFSSGRQPSTWVGPALFTTLPPPPCEEPSGLGGVVTSTSTGTVFWSPSATATSYDLELVNVSLSETFTGVPTETGVTDTFYNYTTLIEGSSYELYVRSECSGDSSIWIGPLEWVQEVPPVNDTCNGAIAIACGTDILVAGHTATDADAPSGCSSSGSGLWYAFTGDGQAWEITATPIGWDNEVHIYSGDCGALVCETWADAGFTGGAETATVNTTPGTEYLVYVGGWGTSVVDIDSFRLEVSCSAIVLPPANDTCGGASLVSCGLDANYEGAAATDADAPSGCSTSGAGLWFTFEGDDQTWDITATPFGWDNEIHVYSGACDGLTCVDWADAGFTDDAESLSIATESGTTYFLYVGGWGTSVTSIDSFNLSITCTPPPACDAPTGLDGMVTGATTGTAFWSPSPTATTYEVELVDVTGGGSFTGVPTATGIIDTFYNATGLTEGNSYELYVRSNCSGDSSEWVGPLEWVQILAPSNDLCVDAEEVTCGSVVSGSTDLATANDAPPTCVTSLSGPGVWYAFTGTGDAATFSTCGTADFDTKIGVFSGSCGAFICESGNDDASGCAGATTEVTVNTSLGTDYFIYVTGFAGATGEFTMSVTCEPIVAGPMNDTCLGAEIITCGTDILVDGTTATAADAPSGCSSSGAGLWYTFTGDGQEWEVTATPIGWDNEIHIYSGNCGALACEDWADTGFTNDAETASVNTTVGEHYFVYVGGWGTSVTDIDSFRLQVSCSPIVAGPANDSCGGAEPVACNTDILVDGSSATDIDAPQGCSASGAGLWYSFTGDGLEWTITATPFGWDNEIHVYTGGCGALECETAADVGFTDDPETVNVITEIGTDYLVYVGGWGTSITDIDSFRLEITCDVPDPCSAGTLINADSVALCPDSLATIETLADSIIPEGGGYGLFFEPGPDGSGALGDEFILFGLNTPYSFEQTLNGILPGNGFPDFAGTWYVYGAVYSDPGNPFNSICSLTDEFMVVTFLEAGVGPCAPPPPAPENDTCGGAIAVTCDLNMDFAGPGATNADAPSGICPGTVGAGVWFTFEGDGQEWEATATPFGWDPEIQIFSGSCGSLTCEDNADTGFDGDPETASVVTEIGTTYYIYVGGWGTSVTEIDSFNLSITCMDPVGAPENDLCTGAIAVECGSSVDGSTEDATADDAPGTCTTSLSGAGIWYTFAGTGDEVTFSTCNTANFDTKIGVFSGDCGSLVCESGNDDAPGCSGFTSEVSVVTTPGTDYFIYVTGFGSATGDFTLNVTCVPPTPVPVNDTCGGAIAIGCDDVVSGSTADATANDAPPTCGTTLGSSPGIWYVFEGIGDSVTFSTCNTAGFDTKIGVFSGSCDDLTCVDGNDDGAGCSGFTSEISVLTELGTDYYVYVTGFGSATGEFDLTVTCAVVEICEDPTDLTVTDIGPDEATVTWNAGGDETVWHLELVDVSGGGVFTGIPTVSGVTETTYTFLGLAPDNDYAVYVIADCGGDSSNWVGPVEFTTLPPPTPLNDLCENAEPVECGSVVSGSTTLATATDAPGFCGTSLSGVGVWYTFAGNGDDVTFSTCNTATYDTKIGVFSGACGALVCEGGNDDASGCSGFTTEVTVSTTPGTNYYIYVTGFGSATGDFDLSVTCETPPPAPENDLCEGAVEVACGSVTSGSTEFATSTDAPGFCGTSVTAPGVWYVFSGTDQDVTFSTCNTADFDTKITVYSGACGALSCEGGNDDGSGCSGFTSEVEIRTYTGTDYYVYVSGFGSATGNFDLSVTCADTCEAIAIDDAVITDVTCASDGGVDITVLSGTAPFSFLWSDGSTDEDLVATAGGTYSVVITGDDGCTLTAGPFEVGEQDAPTETEPAVVTSPGCSPDGLGSIDVTIGGGTPPYSYSWSNGATTEDLSGLTAGTYTLTVTDDVGCTYTTIDFELTDGTSLIELAPAVITNVDCNGNSTGSIDITVGGGTPPYIYRWSNDAHSEDLTGVPAGEYVVYVEDATGCSYLSAIYVITEPDLLTVSGGTADNADCNGENSGSVTGITVAGGTAPYSYLWTNGATTLDLTDAGAGTYQLTVTDANGCQTLSEVFVIGQPSGISLTNVSVTNADCNGAFTGAVDITVAGGTPGYTYNWSNGATTQDLTGVSAGIYSVTITDANGCTYTSADIEVGEAAAIDITAVSTENVSCFGASDGAINISVGGGTPPYTYVWSNGATTQDISGLTSGGYNVTITDASGCLFISDDIFITTPGVLVFSSVETENVSCSGASDGSIDIEVSGGTEPYSYSWSNGATTQDLIGIPAGAYTGTVTDANGCTLTSPAIVITQPSALNITSTNVTDNLCNGDEDGAIDITVSGGTPPYSFNWSNGETTEDISGLAAGFYFVEITDDNGCTIGSGDIEVEEPFVVFQSLPAAVTNVSCNGAADGAIDISLQGGTQPYSVVWSNGATTQDISGLAPGAYSFEVTDFNGCFYAFGEISISEPEELTVTEVLLKDVACFGGSSGSIDITVAGGTPPYTYLWSNGATTQDLSGIPAGDYTGVITDANGCTFTSPVLTIGEPATALTVTFSSTPESGPAAGDGTATVTATGGDGPYTYAWSNFGTTSTITGLSVGNYCATVTDASGCKVTACGVVGLGTAVVDIFAISEMVLYPNPASHTANVRMVFSRAVDVDLALTDVLGRVLEQQQSLDVLEDEVVFDVAALAAGTYFVRVRVEGEVVTLPLIIQH